MPGAGLYRQTIGYEGQWASTLNYRHIASTLQTTINSSESLLPFGRVVALGGVSALGDNLLVDLPDSSADPIGFSVWVDRYARDSQGNTGIPSKQVAPVVKKGALLIKPETDLLTTDSLFYRFAESATPQQFDAVGRLRANDGNGVDGNTSAIAAAIPATWGLKLLKNLQAGEIGVLLIDIPFAE